MLRPPAGDDSRRHRSVGPSQRKRMAGDASLADDPPEQRNNNQPNRYDPQRHYGAVAVRYHDSSSSDSPASSAATTGGSMPRLVSISSIRISIRPRSSSILSVAAAV